MKNRIVLQKMVMYSDKLIRYCDGYDYEAFINDTKLVDACVFNLSQIGELVRILDKDFCQRHHEIPWSDMYGLRNRIVHDYEGVNLLLVWQIISEDIPALKEQISLLVQQEGQRK